MLFLLNLPKQVLISPFVLFLYPDEEIKYKCICLLSKISSSNHSMGIKAGGGLLVFFLSGSASWSAIISSLMEISSKASTSSISLDSSSLATGLVPSSSISWQTSLCKPRACLLGKFMLQEAHLGFSLNVGEEDTGAGVVAPGRKVFSPSGSGSADAARASR